MLSALLAPSMASASVTWPEPARGSGEGEDHRCVPDAALRALLRSAVRAGPVRLDASGHRLHDAAR